MSRWISMDERPPGKKMMGKPILITVHDEVMLVLVPNALNYGRGFFDLEYRGEDGDVNLDFIPILEVSAWMPLPQPYKPSTLPGGMSHALR